jgi:hypothetical protein
MTYRDIIAWAFALLPALGSLGAVVYIVVLIRHWDDIAEESRIRAIIERETRRALQLRNKRRSRI